MLGTRDYLAKNGFTDAVVGLSGRHRLVAGGHRGRRRARPRARARAVHAVALLERRLDQPTPQRAGRDASGSTSGSVPIEPAHEALSGLLDPVLGGPPGRADRREPPVAPAGRAADGGLQRHGMDRAHDREQERDGHGYSTLYGDAAGGFAVIKDVPKTLVYELCRYRNGGPGAGADRTDPRGRAGEAAVGRAPARPARRPDPAPLRGARPGAGGLRRARPDRRRPGGRRASTRPWSTRWSGWSTWPSTSGGRSPPGCASPPRPSARTAGCRSPTATAPRPGRRTAPATGADGGDAWPRPPRAGPARPAPGGRAGRRLPLDRAPAVRADRSAGPPTTASRRCRCYLDAVSTEHAWHAELWADRLPVSTASTRGR